MPLLETMFDVKMIRTGDAFVPGDKSYYHEISGKTRLDVPVKLSDEI